MADISIELHAQLKSTDRPDLAVRVFEQKKKELIELIMKKHIFGKAIGYVYTLEFQKRAYIKLILLKLLLLELSKFNLNVY